MGLITPATVFATSKLGCVNTGFAQRQKWLVFGLNNTAFTKPTLTVSSDAPTNKLALLTTTVDNMKNIFMSYITATATQRTIVFDAIIRLKDVADFFGKLPLLKGSTMRLYLNTNQTYFTLNVYGGGISDAGVVIPNNLALASAPIILGGGQTNPIMIASSDLGQGFAPALIAGVAGAVEPVVATAVIKVGLSIVRNQFTSAGQLTDTGTSAPITSVRLYCPAYSMTSQAESRYLAMSPTKKIVYNDFFSYSLTGQSGNFNVLVSNGLPNLRSVLVVPVIERNSNGTVSATANYISVLSSSLQSPFSSTGGSPDPIAITQFQVQLSGKNAFNANQAYDYEVFSNQLISSNQLNGSLTTGIGSGQIGFSEFENLYRYYYVNASRGQVQDMGVAKSVQIQGNIQSPVTCTLLCFLEFERSINVNVASGQILL
jgi:hypothetical protein